MKKQILKSPQLVEVKEVIDEKGGKDIDLYEEVKISAIPS